MIRTPRALLTSHALLALLNNREMAALKTRLTTLGYQDGVEKGAEEVVQEGFDVGYAAGAAAGWEIGSFYGGAAAVAAALKQVPNLGGRSPTEEQEAAGQVRREVNDSGRGSNPSPENISSGGLDSSPECERIHYYGDRGPGHGGNEDLLQLVEELKQASLTGPDGPNVDKSEIQRRLKLIGLAGEAVAEALAST